MSGARSDRPVLVKLLENLPAGDVLVIWKLDRLGQSLQHLVDLVNDLMARKVGLRSFNDPIDTTTSDGRLTFNLFASLAELERDVICERTQAGLSAARARGRRSGRPRGRPRGVTSKAESTAYAAEALYREGRLSAQDTAENLRIAKSTLYGCLRQRAVKVGPYRRPREVGVRRRRAEGVAVPRKSISAEALVDLHRRLATLAACRRGLAHLEQYSNDVRRAFHQAPVDRIDGGRVNF